jgi:hypothetical protein
MTSTNAASRSTFEPQRRRGTEKRREGGKKTRPLSSLCASASLWFKPDPHVMTCAGTRLRPCQDGGDGARRRSVVWRHADGDPHHSALRRDREWNAALVRDLRSWAHCFSLSRRCTALVTPVVGVGRGTDGRCPPLCRRAVRLHHDASASLRIGDRRDNPNREPSALKPQEATRLGRTHRASGTLTLPA